MPHKQTTGLHLSFPGFFWIDSNAKREADARRELRICWPWLHAQGETVSKSQPWTNVCRASRLDMVPWILEAGWRRRIYLGLPWCSGQFSALLPREMTLKTAVSEPHPDLLNTNLLGGSQAWAGLESYQGNFFFDTGIWTQGSALAKQVPYAWAMPPALFSYFSIGSWGTLIFLLLSPT
jgi:hypothetical protein